LLLLIVIGLTLACQVIPTPPALRDTPRGLETTVPAASVLTPTTTTNALPPGASAPAPATAAPGELPPFPYQPGQPFARLDRPAWQPDPADKGLELALPVDWDQVQNPEVAAGLTLQQRDRLAQTGFVILHSQEAGFSQVQERVALRYGQPYYLTTDAAAQALRLTLDQLLIALEKEELRWRLAAVTQATLDEVLSYLELVPGGALEADVLQAAAYLGVGLRLLDPQAELDPAIAGPVADQVAQILAGRGVEESVLIPGYRDDFTAYRPAGHYAGDPDMEAYYRALAWYGRVVFPHEAGSASPSFSRLPLILTLALRRARIADPALYPDPAQAPTAAQEWAKVAETISFLSGPSLDDGPAEYASLMDRVYGPGLTVVGLADQNAFELFQLYARELPSVQTGADPLAPFRAAPAQRGWRFLGHGFQLDDYLLRQMAGQAAGQPAGPAGVPEARPPIGLELFSLLGSPAATDYLQKSGADGSASNNPARLQALLTALGDDFWGLSASNAWWYALSAQAAAKDDRYPAGMQAIDWAYQDLNSALGAWTGLRRGPRREALAPAPAQATSRPEAPVSAAPPAYVEPDPEVFYRLSHLANSLAEGLSQRGLTGVFAARPDPQGLKSLLQDLLDLGDRLRRLGDIAAGELAGSPPTQADWPLILAPLGPAEERPADWPLPPVQIAAAGAVDGQPLQVATGWIDRLYALAPLADGLYVLQGGVNSYYELPASQAGPLTDEEWLRQLQATSPEPVLAQALYLPQGNPVDVLAFRVGDAYRILPAAGRLNLRAAPDRFSRSVLTLRPGDAITILAGPVQAGGLTWWQVRIPGPGEQPVAGWLVEDPAWYERLW
jgi:hypothetical protein